MGEGRRVRGKWESEGGNGRVSRRCKSERKCV